MAKQGDNLDHEELRWKEEAVSRGSLTTKGGREGPVEVEWRAGPTKYCSSTLWLREPPMRYLRSDLALSL